VPADLRPGAQALAFEVLRHLGGALEVRARTVPKAPPPAVDALLVTALALLWPPPAGQSPAYADHTLVDQAVSAARARVPAAAGFINAVLRRFLRERAALVEAARHAPEAAWEHPLWWIEKLKLDWPEQWQAVLRAAAEHPPMTLRVNRRRKTGAEYVEQLGRLGIAAQLLSEPALQGQAVVLARPRPVHQLPGFAEGEVSVQDANAMRAAPLLLGEGLPEGLPRGARVLDACAAPGGKTAHLLELADLDVLALDVDGQRLTRVQDTLARLQLKGTLKAGDARGPAAWWDGKPFDAILLDAPCTASGIVRRHPDVRWLRRADDVRNLAQVQSALLESLWPLLAPGGRLLYATCSVFRAEGSARIDAFLQRHGGHNARLHPSSPGHLLPLADNDTQGERGEPVPDGFFYALIEKT
jgi:16S rRNA (cytosine967-C5)-methyltransferase